MHAITTHPGRTDEIAQRVAFVLEAQCRLAGDAAHALRTPLAALRTELEEARLHPEHIDLDSLLARTLSAVDRLQRVIEELRLLDAASAAGLAGCGERLRGHSPR